MNNLITRSFTGTIYVAIIIASLLTHPLAFVLVTAAMNFFAVREFLSMHSSGKKTTQHWTYLSTLVFILSAAIFSRFEVERYTILPLLTLVASHIIATLYSKSAENVKFFQLHSSALLYITVPLLLINFINVLNTINNVSIVVIVFLFIWTNDSFAYLFGISFGKHRLFERISPKKSWEGFIGGLLTTLLIAYACYKYYSSQSVLFWLIFAALTVIASTYGDLFESVLKRNAGIKDSGNVLPGHGGVLDRIDSLLFVSPVIYVYLQFQ